MAVVSFNTREPCKDLLCRGVGHFIASRETRDLVWIAWKGSAMSVGVKEINRPMLDLLLLVTWHEAQTSTPDQ